MLNFSPSCERNKDAILAQLSEQFKCIETVLEIGSLSGQHALHITKYLKNLNWQTSDIQENIDSLEKNIAQFGTDNCFAPLSLDVAKQQDWPMQKYDAIFTANSLHIMSWNHVELFFQHIKTVSRQGSLVVVYGPFKYKGEYTSDSNERFQQWLIARDRLSGIRDFELVDRLANENGFQFKSDITMPANNQLITWEML